jgi:hypothetical protein
LDKRPRISFGRCYFFVASSFTKRLWDYPGILPEQM